MANYDPGHDYYADLHLTSDADNNAIRRSYDRLCIQDYRSGSHGVRDGSAPAKSQAIQNAYRVLGDPQTKAEYDNRRTQDAVTASSTHQGDHRSTLLSAAGFLPLLLGFPPTILPIALSKAGNRATEPRRRELLEPGKLDRTQEELDSNKRKLDNSSGLEAKWGAVHPSNDQQRKETPAYSGPLSDEPVTNDLRGSFESSDRTTYALDSEDFGKAPLRNADHGTLKKIPNPDPSVDISGTHSHKGTEPHTSTLRDLESAMVKFLDIPDTILRDPPGYQTQRDARLSTPSLEAAEALDHSIGSVVDQNRDTVYALLGLSESEPPLTGATVRSPEPMTDENQKPSQEGANSSAQDAWEPATSTLDDDKQRNVVDNSAVQRSTGVDHLTSTEDTTKLAHEPNSSPTSMLIALPESTRKVGNRGLFRRVLVAHRDRSSGKMASKNKRFVDHSMEERHLNSKEALSALSLEVVSHVFEAESRQSRSEMLNRNFRVGAEERGRDAAPRPHDSQPSLSLSHFQNRRQSPKGTTDSQRVEIEDSPESVALAMLRMVRRALRPRVPKGCDRLEWTCSCGKSMYGDYSRSEHLAETDLFRVLGSRRPAQGSSRTKPSTYTTSNDQPSALPQQQSGNTADSSNPANETSDVGQGEQGEETPQTGSGIDARNIGIEKASASTCSRSPAFFELCVNRNKNLISLGEIPLVDSLGQPLVNTDLELFGEIKDRYDDLRRKGLFKYLFRPQDIHFVRFGVRQGGVQTGIYQSPLAIPPEVEVKKRRWHYHECPLDPLPPIDSRTFFHYFCHHASHPPTSGSPAFDTLFMNRLPKKLGSSILQQRDPGSLNLGWGVHIIEGPNKPFIAWLGTAILFISFVVSVVYDVLMKNRDSGFAIGQWIVAVLSTSLMAFVFHLGDMV